MAAERPRLICVHPNNEIGGSDIALVRLIEALGTRDYDIAAVVPGQGPITPLLQDAGARVHVLPMVQLRTLPSVSYQARYAARLWPTVRDLAALIRAERADLVYTNSLYCLYGGFAARLAGRAHLWHVREIPAAIPVLRPALGRMVLRLSRVVACMSHAVSDALFGARANDPRIRHIGEGVDLRRWSRSAVARDVRAELGIAPDAPVVGFVARLDPWKGLDVFLEAAAQVARAVPDAVFLVSGDAPGGMEAYRDRMVARAAALGLGDRIRFLGWRYRLDDIPALMAAFDVFCHTAIAPEPFGMVIIEAMAMGCPVIAARSGGPMEIVEDGVSGLLTTPGDAAALAGAMLSVLRDPALRARLAVGGRARVEARYSREEHAADARALFDHALGRSRA
ncbi:glycosyltransferase [Neoroseomonas soli]|uniref:Glycosyltransferase family 4 protein n=1 Tax=Neoroseomonas soli TaxID=1081025 RepID=A0A9X9WX73_9PROT|nr:glycosyltransferase family 4 protein [Neoroseomonas soli]